MHSTVTSIEIQIQDDNDHAPLFYQNLYALSVAEDTATDTTLLSLSADDQDWSSENTHLDYAILGGNEEKRFCLEVKMIQLENQIKNVAKLVLCQPLDREVRDSYVLTVMVSDRGSPPLNSSAVVVVNVTDCNDNAPVFSSSQYYADVSENSPVGTTVVQVTARDLDKGTNALLRYDIISGNTKGHLKLDPQSGRLVVNHALDYEEDSKYTLTIRASDGGELSEDHNIAFTVVHITVLDENDNSPYFMFPTVNCSVSENLPIFTHTCSVHAVDNDLGRYGQLTYSILSSCLMDYGSGSPDRKDAFGIDSFTGHIHTRQTFDFERESKYCLIVEARDKGHRAVTVKVQVSIKGVDEFSPVFTQKQYHYTLPANVQLGETVGYVMAMDHDGGVDGIVEYSLVDSPPFFSINKTFGAIFVSGPVFRQRGRGGRDTVELLVSAASPRLGSKSSTCSVFVNISSSAEALTAVPLDRRMLSLTVSLITFLVALVILVVMVLNYKIKDSAVEKSTATATAESLRRTNSRMGSVVSLQEIKRPSTVMTKRDKTKTFKRIDSSVRGSAEGQTAEDQSNSHKLVTHHPYSQVDTSVKANRSAKVSDSASPADLCSSGESDAEHILSGTKCFVAVMSSTESLHTFKEEGGGEELLPATLRDFEEASMATKCYPCTCEACVFADPDFSLLCPVEQGSCDWDHLLDWDPRFQTLAHSFTDLEMLQDEELEGGREDLAAESSCLMYPPALIMGVARSGIRTEPPENLRRVPSVSRKNSRCKYAYSPLTRSRGLTPSAMTPASTLSLSSLTMRTPTASPVVSETGVGSIRLK